MNFIDIVFASLLANNLLFFRYLGLGEFLLEDGKQLTIRSLVLGILLTTTSLLFWIPDHFLLVPFHLEFARTVVLLLDLWLVTSLYSLIRRGGPHPRELVVHSLLVGGTVIIGTSSPDWLEMVTAAVAVAVGYGLALGVLRAVFSRLARERIPVIIQGLPLQLMTMGLVWLALQGLGLSFAGKGT